MKKLMLTESLPPAFVIDVPGVNCAQLFSIAALSPSENLNHSATIAPSGGGMSFINLKGDEVLAQSGGGRSFAGRKGFIEK